MEISALGVWLVELSVAGVGRECRQLLAWDSMVDLCSLLIGLDSTRPHSHIWQLATCLVLGWEQGSAGITFLCSSSNSPGFFTW